MAAFDNVVRLLGGWQPSALASESEYRNSLALFLGERLKNATIETEYRQGGALIDIYLKQAAFLGTTDVFIKVKKDLIYDATLDHLVAAVDSFQPTINSIVIVLCGETNPRLLARLRQEYEVSLFRPDPPLEIVVLGDQVARSAAPATRQHTSGGRGSCSR
jgi:hypothetical protein